MGMVLGKQTIEKLRLMLVTDDQWPNTSLEPTPVVAVSSAYAVGIANPAWLSSWSLGGIVCV